MCPTNQFGEALRDRDMSALSSAVEHRDLILERAILTELEFAFDAVDRHLESNDRLRQIRL